MSEDRRRPATFSQAMSQTKVASDQALSRIGDWAQDYQDQLDDAADALAKESEDKGFWGKLLTFGTTIGCIAIDVTSGGMCTVAGAIVGAAARAIADAKGDAEDMIPTDVDIPEHMKYYRDKMADVAEDVDRASDKLESYNANEWKTDLLKQIGDSYSAYKMGTGLEKAGAFDGLRDSLLPTQAPTELTAMAQNMIDDPMSAMDMIDKANAPTLATEKMDFILGTSTDSSYLESGKMVIGEQIPVGALDTNQLSQSGIQEMRDLLQPDIPSIGYEDLVPDVDSFSTLMMEDTIIQDPGFMDVTPGAVHTPFQDIMSMYETQQRLGIINPLGIQVPGVK